jgi:hypothetical protein
LLLVHRVDPGYATPSMLSCMLPVIRHDHDGPLAPAPVAHSRVLCLLCCATHTGRGRHAPRSRTTADEGHASAPLAQSLMVIEDGDAGWLDFFDAQDLPGPGEPPAPVRGAVGGGGRSSVPGSAGPSGGGAVVGSPAAVFGLGQRSTSSTGGWGGGGWGGTSRPWFWFTLLLFQQLLL